MCLGFVKNYHEFVAVRAILGICEGGLLPGMVSFELDITARLKLRSRGLVSVRDVYQRRNGSQAWSLLHSRFTQRRLRR